MAELPSWQPLEGGGVPISDGAGRGRVVALVAARGAVRGGWAAEAAIDLARAWSAAGKKVVLADAALGHPALHVAAGLENGEGLSDASLYGASVRRIARPVDDGAFFMVTAGSPVADAAGVARTHRWRRLCDGFEEAGVTLLLFMRDGDDGCAAFLASASDVIVFAERGEAPPALVAERPSMVRAVTGPAGAGAAGASPPGAGAREASPPGAGEPDAARRGQPPSSRPAGRTPPTRAGSKPERASGSRPRVLLVLLVVLLLLVLLAVLGIIQVPFISPEPAGALGARPSSSPEPARAALGAATLSLHA